MKVFNITISFAIIALNIYVSFNHTLTLFRAGGFSQGGLLDFLPIDIAAVVAAELVFFMGCVNIIYSRVKNIPAGLPAYLTGGLGVCLIMWSNIYTHTNYGPVGIILGVCVPLGIVFSELMFSHAVTTTQKTSHMVNDQSHEQPHNTQDERTELTQPHTKNGGGVDSHDKRLDTQDSHGLTTNKVSQSHTQQDKTTQSSHTDDKAHKQSGNSHRTSQKEKSAPHKMNKDSHTKNKRSHTKNKRPHTQKDLYAEFFTIEDGYTRAMKISQKHYEIYREYPSIRKLADIADVGDWTARKVKQELKKKVG